MSVVWVIYPGTSKIYVYDSPTRVQDPPPRRRARRRRPSLPGFRVALSALFGDGAEETEDVGDPGESCDHDL